MDSQDDPEVVVTSCTCTLYMFTEHVAIIMASNVTNDCLCGLKISAKVSMSTPSYLCKAGVGRKPGK